MTVQQRIQKGKIKTTRQQSQLPKADAYIIYSTTGQINNQAGLTAVFEVSKKNAKKANINTLAAIKSTILPSTSKKIFEEYSKVKICLFMHHTVTGQIKKTNISINQVRVMGGVNAERLDVDIKFYKKPFGHSNTKTAVLK